MREEPLQMLKSCNEALMRLKDLMKEESSVQQGDHTKEESSEQQGDHTKEESSEQQGDHTKEESSEQQDPVDSDNDDSDDDDSDDEITMLQQLMDQHYVELLQKVDALISRIEV
ncbi:nuclear polyadenylated RNA-binding protein 3, partial [Eurytemora carolleeae]|uniref:nuclear polyadenylated RNA-binding protein 3 n=1 Tax=Eurytemora carolleeae TaxID=1294199 RepID=UPI000C77EC74